MAVTFEDRKASVTITQSWNGTGTDPGGAQATVNHPGMAVATVQVVGALNLTLVPEVSTDEATWVAVNAMNLNSGAKAQTITAAGLYRVDVAGARLFRARCSAYTSGNPVVTVNAAHASTDGNSAGTGTGANQVQGTAGTGTALSGNPVRVGISDGTNAQDARAANGDALAKEGVLAVNAMVWNGATFDRMFAASQRADGSSGVTMPTAPAYHFNGTNWDRTRSANSVSNTTGTGLQGVGPLVYDGANWQKIAGDTGGRLIVQGPVASNATGLSGLNPVAVGGIAGDGTTARYVAVNNGTSDGQSNTFNGFVVQPQQLFYNGATWDRVRNNMDVTLLASAARTTTQGPTNVTTYNARAIYIVLDMTNVAAAPSVTLKVEMIDPASGKAIVLLTGAAVTTVTTNIYKIGVGLTAAANLVANEYLPRTLAITVTANNANSGTYSVGYSLITA